MKIKVLILGESGTGKSASLRNFTKDEVFLVNVANKPLPFKCKGGQFEQVASDNYRDIRKSIAATTKPVVVIDDSQYLMANEFMRRATEKGFDKFTEIAQNYWELLQATDKTPDNTITYVLAHLERDQNGNEKIKTIGKLLDEKITVEGMYTIVLKTVVQDGKYYFQTQNSGHDTCKSPMGLFNNFLIDNDLKAVDEAIREFYDLAGTPVKVAEPVKEVVVEEPVQEKSLAEKLADFQNKEPEAVTPARRQRTSTPSTQPVVETTPSVETTPVAEEGTVVRRTRRRTV